MAAYNLAQEENFNYAPTEDNLLLASWHQTGLASMDQNGEQVFFTLILKAEEDIRLSDALGIRESRSLNPEAYRAEEPLRLGLNFTSESASSFSLEQNTPNPFRTSSQIKFALAQEEEITFSVQNLQGQIIYQFNGKYAAGEHLITLNRQLLENAQGVLSYTLSTADVSLTKKMVLLP